MQIFQLLALTALSIMASIILTSIELPILKHRQFRQFIREEGPQSHLSKKVRRPWEVSLFFWRSV